MLPEPTALDGALSRPLPPPRAWLPAGTASPPSLVPGAAEAEAAAAAAAAFPAVLPSPPSPFKGGWDGGFPDFSPAPDFLSPFSVPESSPGPVGMSAAKPNPLGNAQPANPPQYVWILSFVTHFPLLFFGNANGNDHRGKKLSLGSRHREAASSCKGWQTRPKWPTGRREWPRPCGRQ